MILLVQLWAYGGTLLGMWLNGRKYPGGPLLGVIGFIPWSILALSSHMFLMVAFNAIMSSLQLRAFLIWRRDEAH